MADIVSVNFDEILASFERATFASVAEDRLALEDECVLAGRRGWESCAAGTVLPSAAEDAVREYVREELTDDALATHEHGASRWALFAAYAIGWIFALQRQNRLDELSALNATAALPGFMWLHEERISGPPPA